MPPQAVLQAYFNYIPETGEFSWKDEPHINKRVRGKTAGTTGGGRGYRAVYFKDRFYQAHRLIWMWMTGNDPGKAIIDHINWDRSDNRWSNLRLSDWSKNTENLKNGRPTARKLAEPNISMQGGSFRVQLKRDGVRYRKCFKSMEEAVQWRDEILSGCRTT